MRATMITEGRPSSPNGEEAEGVHQSVQGRYTASQLQDQAADNSRGKAMTKKSLILSQVLDRMFLHDGMECRGSRSPGWTAIL
jgi:hypothetical protein